MMQKLMELIEEQVAVEFTGKINILRKHNKQFQGQIFFKDGSIVQTSYEKKKGIKACYQLLIDEYRGENFNFVIEPEVVTDDEIETEIDFSQLREDFPKILEDYQQSLKLRPPEHIKLIIDPEILEDSLPLSLNEFEVLKTLTDVSSIKELYEKCQLLEHEVTLALVSLRKKEGIITLGVKEKNENSNDQI